MRSVPHRLVAVVLAAAVTAASSPARAQEPSAPPPPPPAAEPSAAPAAAESSPPVPPAAALTDDEEYARFVASMPNDYDINYAYVKPAGGGGRPDRGGGSAKGNTRALGIAGGTFLTLGSLLGIAGIGLGAAAANESDLAVPAIATGATGGVLLALGTGLLLRKRAIRRKNGELPSKPAMTDSQRKSAVILGYSSLTLGVIGIGGGAALLAKDSESKGGATLVAFGAIFTALAFWPLGRLAADRARRNRTAQLSPAPLMLGRGGGVGVVGSF